ncbi:MAG: c-type cytochrome [Desulfobacteraceae bacterium]
MNLFKPWALFPALVLLVLLTPPFAVAQDDDDAAYEALLEKGKQYYNINCRICHGEKGDGKGFVDVIRYAEQNGRVIETFPRDFTFGTFKFRSASTGCLPSPEDLQRTIKEGIDRSFMPPQEKISDEELRGVTEYVMTFSDRFEEEDLCDQITAVIPEYLGSPKSIDKGKEVYKRMKCFDCHGDDGKGNGPKANDIKDDWGKKILPFNFVAGNLKRGSSAENIYMTFTTGLDGSGMPSYEDSLTEEERWHIVSFTMKLMGLAGEETKGH